MALLSNGEKVKIERDIGAPEKTRNGLSLADSDGESEPENLRLAELRNAECGDCRRMKRRLMGWRVDNRVRMDVLDLRFSKPGPRQA